MKTKISKDPESRFWVKVEKTEQCWNWLAGKSDKGYGVFSLDYKPIRAHRYSWILQNGEIPEGLVLDHLCENKSCVNPSHLELVTNSENLRRGKVGQKNAKHHRAKTHCRNGHEYTQETTAYWNRKSRGILTRKCLVCYAEQQDRFTKTNKGENHS